MIKLFDTTISGNCYKVRLLLSFLQLPHTTQSIDLMTGMQRKPDYLGMNPFGLVPVLQDDDYIVRDSQAILVYLAKKHAPDTWYSDSAKELGLIQQWLSTAANEIANGFALARAYHKFKRPGIDLNAAVTRAQEVLAVMDNHLAKRTWLELDRPTIADVACFPYMGLAQEGEIDVTPFTHVKAWLQRFAQLPHFIPMPGLADWIA